MSLFPLTQELYLCHKPLVFDLVGSQRCIYISMLLTWILEHTSLLPSSAKKAKKVSRADVTCPCTAVELL